MKFLRFAIVIGTLLIVAFISGFCIVMALYLTKLLVLA